MYKITSALLLVALIASVANNQFNKKTIIQIEYKEVPVEVEKIIEVPVEKIVEVEKIVKVPVEKIIEVPITKEVEKIVEVQVPPIIQTEYIQIEKEVCAYYFEDTRISIPKPEFIFPYEPEVNNDNL